MTPLLLTALVVGAATQKPAEPRAETAYETHLEDVLGTSCFMRLANSEVGPDLEQATLQEIERLRGILDSYDPASELRSLAPNQETQVSNDLVEVLRACEHWRTRTQGAFDPAVAQLAELWQSAERAGSPPSESELEAARIRMNSTRWRIEQGTVTPSSSTMAIDGLAKGYIIDRAVDAALASGATQVVLDIGGDLLVRGTKLEVSIASPARGVDNAPPLDRIFLEDAALATSGNHARGYRFGKELMGHVLDPRSGRIAKGAVQASVVAPKAADADALATALMVLTPEKSLELVASLPDTECLLVDLEGIVLRSEGWGQLSCAEPGDSPASLGKWATDKQVCVEFTISPPQKNKRSRGRTRAYKRPYVAIWVEGPDGEPVRTLCLWIARERWLRDLRRWYRHAKDDADHIAAVSRPTRPPGTYQMLWDGLDDEGQTLELGEYTIVIEVAREHGSYQLSRAKFDTREPHGLISMPSNPELSSAQLSFGPRSTRSPSKPN